LYDGIIPYIWKANVAYYFKFDQNFSLNQFFSVSTIFSLELINYSFSL